MSSRLSRKPRMASRMLKIARKEFKDFNSLCLRRAYIEMGGIQKAPSAKKTI